MEKEETNKKDIALIDTGELDLAGIDDEEMDGYIKSEAEAKMTADMWMAMNGEFMKELEGKQEVNQNKNWIRRETETNKQTVCFSIRSSAKQKRKAEEEEERQRRGEKRKRKTARKQPQSYSANTAGSLN